MCTSKSYRNKYFPIQNDRYENDLICNFIYNARYIWNLINKLSSIDMTDILNKIDCFKILNNEQKTSNEPLLLKKLPAMVLLPKLIDENFIREPNLNSLQTNTYLQVSCIHREQIKLEGSELDENKNELSSSDNIILITKPHILHGKCLQLGKNDNAQISYQHLYMILITCLDLEKSTVS